MDANNAPPVDEFPLQFLSTLASLKYLALTNLALHLWHRNQLEPFPSKYCKANFKCEQVLRVPLPGSITKIINERIRSMGRELQTVYCSFELLGIVHHNRTFLRFFDSLTYGPDGTMSSERSARNLLTRRELTSVMKFPIACVYWFEDEIRRLWPSVSDRKELKAFGCFRNFTNCWIAGMRNDLFADRLENLSLLWYLWYNWGNRMKACNWTAFLYLLNTLTTEEQLSFISRLVTDYKSEYKYILSKLNETQVRHILLNYLKQIITELTFDEGCTEYAIRIWNLVRNNIESGPFFSILDTLSCHAYGTYDISEEMKFKNAQAKIVLLEIWITAPNRLKMEFFDTNVNSFFAKLGSFSGGVRQHPDKSMKFFSELFSDMPMEMRYDIWHSHWPKMVVRCSVKMLNHLIKLCLDDKNVIERFVEEEMLNLTKIKDIVDNWFTQKLYNQIINYVELCSWNETLVRELRKQIFTTRIPSPKLFRLDDLTKLAEVIDKSLSNDFEANDLKRTILFTNNVQKLLWISLKKDRANETISVINRVLSTERTLLEKKLFWVYWGDYLDLLSNRNRRINSSLWKDFFLWWVENKDDVPCFKQFLPVDKIFEKLLMKSVSNLSSRLGSLKKEVHQRVLWSIGKPKEFAHLDAFLMWYFDDEKAIRNYKENQIENNFQNMAKLKNLLSISSNECIVNHILLWFFNDNLIRVARFKNFKINVPR